MYGLKQLLRLISAPNPDGFILHDLRRGHAEDLRIGGATLGEVLAAGDWKSPAFLSYLDKAELEADRTCEAHHADSSDEQIHFSNS